MRDLLIYESAHRRVGPALGPQVRALVMGADGSVTADGMRLDPGAVHPEIAWANRDLYLSGPVRQFMVTCLKSPGLRWVQTSAAGVEHPIFAKILEKGALLTNANASAVPIAEFVMARVLEAFHPGVERRAAQADRRWQQLPFRDVHGTTWLVFGLGHIGREVAKRARAFGARVLGVRRSPRGDEPVDALLGPADLLAHLPGCDVVVLTAALNPSTRHVVNDAFVGALTQSSVLVNVGRGGLVDEPALLRGLEQGRPALAILDVFEEEPLPPQSPFWLHSRVWLSAHCAGASEGTSSRGDAIFLDNLRRYLTGEPLAMQVSLPATGV